MLVTIKGLISASSLLFPSLWSYRPILLISLVMELMERGDTIDGFMAGSATNRPSDIENHGLRFMNEEWNGSIANGEPFTVRWNQSLKDQNGDLRLFKISYPQDGFMSFELVSNLTDSMEAASCLWTPENLDENELYAFWVTKQDDLEPDWAISPPWKPKLEPHGFHWTAPIGIPIVVILGVYFTCLITCIIHRRSMRTKRERERNIQLDEVVPLPENTGRQGSFSSVATVHNLTEEDEFMKKDEWVFTNEPPSPKKNCCNCGDQSIIQFREDAFDLEARIGLAR